MSKKSVVEFKTLQTLSQRLSTKQPYLSDFALNKLALEYAIIKNYITFFDLKKYKISQKILEMIKTCGEAIAVSNLDVLSQLGLKVGKTVKTIEL